MSSKQEEIKTWQDIIFDKIMVLSFLVFFSAFVIIFLQEFNTSSWLTSLISGIASLGLAAATWGRRLSYHVRSCLFVAAVFSACINSVLVSAFWVPNTFGAFTLVIGIMVITRGNIYGWISLTASIFIFVTIALYYVLNDVQPNFERADPSQVMNWVRVISIFVVGNLLLIAGISYLIKNLEQAIAQNKELLDTIKTKSEHSIQALEARQQLEIKLQESQKMEALGRLSGGIAHDFNNLLVVIINNSILLKEELEQKKITADVETKLDHIQQAGERAAELTKQLMTFGSKKSDHNSSLNLNTIVESSLSLISRLIPSNIAITFPKKSQQNQVRVTEVEINQIILNLSLNARDAMPDGGQFIISTHFLKRNISANNVANYVVLTLKDTGIGMNEEIQKHLFEPFYTTKKANQGTGLGLSVVFGIIQQCGGFIEIDSSPGLGSSFSLFFPASDGEEKLLSPKHNIEATNVQISPHQGKRILIVDDDDGVLNILTTMLANAGYQVLVCKDGLEALESFQEQPNEIDLIFTDAIMPNMGGFELYENVSTLSPETPFIFCSGYSSETLATDFFDHPNRLFVAKPFNYDELLNAVKTLLDKH